MRILYLSPWFPYPPNQGSKIRSYHLLKALGKENEIALVSYTDNPVDPDWRDHMASHCSHVEVISDNPFAPHPLRRTLGWFTFMPSSAVAADSLQMSRAIGRLAREWCPDAVLAFTYVTAPYAFRIPRVFRMADADNFVTRMLFEEMQRAINPVQRARRWLTWRKFRSYERRLWSQFDLCFAVSNGDRKGLLDMLNGRGQVQVVPNGVDVSYNHPGLGTPEPSSLVFSGALTYKANLEGVDYFLREILPLIRVGVPDLRLRITGRTDGVPVAKLPGRDHVLFTGYLDDIRPVVASSWACIVPLLSGGGSRIKILEAMALGTPVVTTSKGAEGLDVVPGKHLLIADTPERFAAETTRLLKSPELRATLSKNGRSLVEEHYSWDMIGSAVAESVREGVAQSRWRRSNS